MKGYVALTTILIITPLLLLMGINSLYSNITTLSVSKMNFDSQRLSINSDTCLEEAIYKIKRNRSFVGDLEIIKDDWSCSTNIADKQGEIGIKIITVVTIDESVKLTIKRELNTNSNPFEISYTE